MRRECCEICRVGDVSTAPDALVLDLVVSHARRVGDGVRQVMLLVDTCKQVRHRTGGVDGHVLTAVCLGLERHVHWLLELVRL